MINLALFLLANIAPDVAGSIAASSANYDGSMLILDGEVSLDHGFGMMKAEKAVLTRQLQESAEFPFMSIDLAEAVHLKLSSKAEVECERASLDFTTLQGKLSSPKEVHYIDTAFELFSPFLDLQMLKNSQKKDSYDIEKAHAHHGVRVIYDKFYHLNADSIVFADEKLRSEGEGRCLWSFQNDRVEAEAFELDLAHRNLHLKTATGHLTSMTSGDVQFTAEDLDWKHEDNHLFLKGFPKVQDASFGTIASEQEIDLTLKENKLHKLSTRGPTELTSIKGHLLKTDGTIDVDAEKNTAIVHSQLQYSEDEMTLIADQAQIFYPDKVELQGNIKIFSEKSHKGVADTLTYNPETRTCILKAHPGKKVLFTREEDKLALSANEIHITYDPVTKEQLVRGVGHITLSLSPEEQNILNKVFHGISTSP